jgi:hypothetical protein
MIISDDGIEVNRNKLLAMNSWIRPTTGKQIQKHLGFFNYFRELIPLYSQLMAPLEGLRNVASFKWKPEFEDIYQKVYSILTSDLVLSFPDFSQPFLIGTDASKQCPLPNH